MNLVKTKENWNDRNGSTISCQWKLKNYILFYVIIIEFLIDGVRYTDSNKIGKTQASPRPRDDFQRIYRL